MRFKKSNYYGLELDLEISIFRALKIETFQILGPQKSKALKIKFSILL